MRRNLPSNSGWEITAIHDQAHTVCRTLDRCVTGFILFCLYSVLGSYCYSHRFGWRKQSPQENFLEGVAVYIWKRYLSCACKIGKLYPASFIPYLVGNRGSEKLMNYLKTTQLGNG